MLLDSAACTSAYRACILVMLLERSVVTLFKRGIKLDHIGCFYRFNTEIWKSYLLQCGTSIHSLDLDKIKGYNNESLVNILTVQDLCQWCPLVTRIILSFELTMMDYDCIEKAWAATLTNITLHNCGLDSIERVLLLLEKCKQLQVLSYWKEGTDNILNLVDIFRVCSTNLQTIFVWGIPCNMEMVQCISDRFHMLKELTFLCTPAEYDEDGLIGWMALSKGCRLLEKVSISNRSFTDAGILAIALNGKLSKFSFNKADRITDTAVYVAAQYCNMLTIIRFYCCDHVTVESIASLISSNPLLSVFDLSDVPGNNYDLIIHAITNYCPFIQSINLMHANISDAAVERLVKASKCLNHLTLSPCPHITDATLIAISTYCARIILLQLPEVTGLTLEGLRYLGKHCPCIPVLVLNPAVASQHACQDIFGLKVSVGLHGKIVN